MYTQYLFTISALFIIHHQLIYKNHNKIYNTIYCLFKMWRLPLYYYHRHNNHNNIITRHGTGKGDPFSLPVRYKYYYVRT